MKRIAIVGSRGFKQLDLVKNFIYCRIKQDYDLWEIDYDGGDLKPVVEIVSGAGGDVDCYAARIAREFGIPVKEFPAQWRPGGVYDNQAGIKRNRLIAEYSDIVIAFFDGRNYRNSGTLSTVSFAEELGKPWKIIGPYDHII